MKKEQTMKEDTAYMNSIPQTENSMYDTIRDKRTRLALLDRIEVLNKVKALMLIPCVAMLTTQQAADYFEIDVSVLQKCYQHHRDELTENGAVSYTPTELAELIGQNFQLVGTKGKQLCCVDENQYFEIANRGSKFFPPRALLNLAMLLPNSRVAREVRNQLLNIAENAAPETRIEEIVNEQDMMLQIGKAFTSGDIMSFAEATQRYQGYLNRNLSAARAEAERLSQEKTRLSEINEKLSAETVALSAANNELEEKSNALHAANMALAGESLVWEPRATLNALIRAIAASAFNHKYSLAWDKFYRELKYRTGIHIATRSGARNGDPVLDSVKDAEWPQLLKVVASLCYDYCMDVVHATNAETVARYKLDTIETEFGVRYNRGTVTRKLSESEIRQAPRHENQMGDFPQTRAI